VEEKYLAEIVRVAGSRIHTVSAFLGGVASQEAIKMMIAQYTVMNNVFVYDGIHGKGQSLTV